MVIVPLAVVVGYRDPRWGTHGLTKRARRLAVVLGRIYAQKGFRLMPESSAICLSQLYFADLISLVIKFFALVYCSRCGLLFLALYFCHASCFLSLVLVISCSSIWVCSTLACSCKMAHKPSLSCYRSPKMCPTFHSWICLSVSSQSSCLNSI